LAGGRKEEKGENFSLQPTPDSLYLWKRRNANHPDPWLTIKLEGVEVWMKVRRFNKTISFIHRKVCYFLYFLFCLVSK
jgi:hypothetical protein